jgi:hypothetical protein
MPIIVNPLLASSSLESGFVLLGPLLDFKFTSNSFPYMNDKTRKDLNPNSKQKSQFYEQGFPHKGMDIEIQG